MLFFLSEDCPIGKNVPRARAQPCIESMQRAATQNSVSAHDLTAPPPRLPSLPPSRPQPASPRSRAPAAQQSQTPRKRQPPR